MTFSFEYDFFNRFKSITASLAAAKDTAGEWSPAAEQLQELRSVAKVCERSSLADAPTPTTKTSRWGPQVGRADSAVWFRTIPFLKLL